MKFEIVFGVESHVFSFGRPFLENRCPSLQLRQSRDNLSYEHKDRRRMDLYNGAELSNVYIVPFCPPAEEDAENDDDENENRVFCRHW